MTNSAKMTVEEMLVQRLKEDSLASLVTNEDALTELAERAIKEALFAPRGTYKDRPSPVVEAAAKIAEQVTQEVAEELLANEEVRKLIKNAVLEQLPNAIMKYTHCAISTLMQNAELTARSQVNELRERIRLGTL